jgi:hypothetical protein
VYTRLMTRLFKWSSNKKYALGESTRPVEPAKSEVDLSELLQDEETKSQPLKSELSFNEFVTKFQKDDEDKARQTL